MRLLIAALIGAVSWSCAQAPASNAQEIVKFEATKPYTAERVLLRAELFRPQGPGPFPAVILMHGCGGWQPAVRTALHTHALYLIERGFVVLNLDSFTPRQYSDGKLCPNDGALRKALNYRTYDAFDGLKYLRTRKFVDANNVFLMGQSNGGSVAMNAAKATASRDYEGSGLSFRAIVAYYPWCGIFGGSKVSLGSPLLIFGGGKDDWVPARECEGIRTTGADEKLTIYPNAAHSFDIDIKPQRYLGKLIGNDRSATEDSRKKMAAFFIDHLTVDGRYEIAAVTSANNKTTEKQVSSAPF